MESKLSDNLDANFFDEKNIFCCPNCKSEFLHHDYVQICGKDYKKSSVNNSLFFVSDQDDIAIGFYCEMCDANIELVVTQHKGNTGLSALVTPKGRMIEKLR